MRCRRRCAGAEVVEGQQPVAEVLAAFALRFVRGLDEDAPWRRGVWLDGVTVTVQILP